MSIKTQAQLTAGLPDNSTGLIVPQNVRDMVDTMGGRVWPNAFVDCNYNCSRDPATAMSAQWSAAISAISPDPKDGIKRAYHGPGWINLSDLTTSLVATANAQTVFYFDGTQVVLGTFLNGGLASHPTSARTMIRSNKGSDLWLIGRNGASFHGASNIINDTNNPFLYASAADWGTHVAGIHIINMGGYDCITGPILSNFDSVAGAEELERGSSSGIMVGNLVGDGVTTDTITVNPWPVRSDNGANKIKRGDILTLQASRDWIGGRRSWHGYVDTATNNHDGTGTVKFTQPVQVGTTIIGTYSTTFSGAHGTSTGNKVTVADGSGLFVNDLVIWNYDDATQGSTWIIAKPSTNVLILADPLSKAAANGNAFSRDSDIVSVTYREFPPAVTYDFIEWCVPEQGYTLLPTSASSERLFYMGSTQNTVVATRMKLYGSHPSSFLSGGSRFGVSFDSTSTHTQAWCKYFEIMAPLQFRDFMTQDQASGGNILQLGVQGHVQRGVSFDGASRISLNQANLTLAADVAISQNYVQTVEDLTQVKKFGYAVNTSTGEPTLVALTAINVGTFNATTINNGGGYAPGATAIVVTSATGYGTNSTISIVTTAGTRYNRVTSVAGSTLNLAEALDASVNNGAAVTRLSSNKSSATARGDTNTNIVRCFSTDPRITTGLYWYARVVAIDTTRAVGQHRIYVSGGDVWPGTAFAGTAFNVVDNNWMVNNGAEIDYHKSPGHNFGLVYDNTTSMFQGAYANKNGEEGKEAGNSGKESTLSETWFKHDINAPHDLLLPSNLCIYVQGYGMTIGPNVWVDEQPGGVMSLHNATACSKLRMFQSGGRRMKSGRCIQLFQPSGYQYEIKDCIAAYHAEAFSVNEAGIINHTNNAGASSAFGPRGDFRDIWLNGMEWDTKRVLRQDALMGTGFDRTPCWAFDSSFGNTQQPIAIRDVHFDGFQGRTDFGEFLELRSSGRMGRFFFESGLDLSGYASNKADLIKLETSSGGTVIASPLSTVTVASQVAGDRQISIADRMDYGIFAGSQFNITLDNASILTTWRTNDSDGTGVIKLYDAIPAGRSVNNGGTVTFRPKGQIFIATPRNLGYEWQEIVPADGVATSVTLLLPGKFTKYRTSPGAPDPENTFINAVAGDREGVNILIGYPTITPNDNSQAGGSIVWPITDPTSPATPKAPAAGTKFIVGFSQPTLRFSA